MKILIYGANGYTGKLIVEEALKQGLKPVIAGRNGAEIQDLANHHKLEHLIFSLADPSIDTWIDKFDFVLHCAGPYTITGKPMIDSCLRTGTHYLDITGEIEIFEYCLEKSEEAVSQGVLLLPGCGFDIIPTENLAAMLWQRSPNARKLKIAIYGLGKPSKGTAKSMIKVMGDGSKIIQNGELVKSPFTKIRSEFSFLNGKKRICVATPLPDLIAVPRYMKLDTFEMYYSMKPSIIRLANLFRPLMVLFRISWIAGIARKLIGWLVSNPDEYVRDNAPSYVTGTLEGNGKTSTAFMKTPNAYTLTARTTVAAMKLLLENETVPNGYQAPSQVLGYDFITKIDGVEVEFR